MMMNDQSRLLICRKAQQHKIIILFINSSFIMRFLHATFDVVVVVVVVKGEEEEEGILLCNPPQIPPWQSLSLCSSSTHQHLSIITLTCKMILLLFNYFLSQ